MLLDGRYRSTAKKQENIKESKDIDIKDDEEMTDPGTPMRF